MSALARAVLAKTVANQKLAASTGGEHRVFAAEPTSTL